MSDAFISYSRRDKPFVERLAGALAAQGRKAWVDWEGIPPSAEWMREIHHAIDEAQSFIFVVSPHSAASKICCAEVDHALAGNKRLIPLVLSDVDETTLPKPIRERNWIWCRDSDPFDPAIAEVIASMSTDLEWVRAHTRLLGRSSEWERHDREFGYALHGADLRKAEEAMAAGQGKEPALTRLQVEYVLASRRAADRRRRRVTMAASAAAAIVAVLAVLYWATQRESRHNLARDFHDAAISALVDRKYGLAEVLLARGLAIDDTADTRERLIEARSRTAKLLWTSPVPEEGATLATISPDGSRFVRKVGSRVEIWTIGQARATLLDVGDETVGAMAFSADGRRLATGLPDRIAIWDVDGKEPRKVRTLRLDTRSGIARVIFAASGTLLAAATEDKRILIFDLTVPDDTARDRLPAQADKVRAIAIDAEGLVSGGWDNNVDEWRLSKPAAPDVILQGHTDAVLCVAISPDGRLIASGGWDNSILIWDRGTGRQLRALTGHQGGVLSLAFSADGTWLVSGSEDQTARLWEVATGRHVVTLVGHASDVSAVAFAGPAGERIVTGDAEGHVRVWDRDSIGRRPELMTLRGHAGPVSTIAFDDKSPTLASGSWDKSVRLWSLNDGRLLRVLTGHTDSVTSVRFGPDGHSLASASKDTTVRLWDLRSGAARVLREAAAAPAKVRDVVFDPAGARLASAGDDGAIRFWAVSDGHLLASIAKAHQRTINSLAFRPGSDELASASDDGTIALWDSRTLHKAGRDLDVVSNDKGVWQIAFAPDGAAAVSGGDDRRLHVWDMARRAEIGAAWAHQGSVWSVDIAADGRHVASGASDGTVHLFDASGSGAGFTLRESLVIRVTDGPVWWVVFDHAPGRPPRLAVGGVDRTIRIIDIARLAALLTDPPALERDAEAENGLKIVSDDPRTGVEPVSGPRLDGSAGR